MATLSDLLDEIERLRRERDTLDSGLDGLEQAIHYQDWPAVVAFFRAARRLLDGEKAEAHTTVYRQLDECSDGWECTAPDCDTAWTLPDGGPSHHRMRYCPGCGRRIVGEEPWRVGVDYGEDGGDETRVHIDGDIDGVSDEDVVKLVGRLRERLRGKDGDGS